MFNAAVTAEGFDPNHPRNFEMDHQSWNANWDGEDPEDYDPDQTSGYAERFWARNWHELFPSDDHRHRLDWRGRFADVATATETYNFFSGGDPVFIPHEGTISDYILVKSITDLGMGSGLHAWPYQERLKGRTYLNILGSTHVRMGIGRPSSSTKLLERDSCHASYLLHALHSGRNE